MNILDRDILKYALLVIIGFWICKLFLNSHEGFTCEYYAKNNIEGGYCGGDPNNPSKDCCNIVMNLQQREGGCWGGQGRGAREQRQLNQRIHQCTQMSGSSSCFTPDSEYTLERCCDNSKGPYGDTQCWGDGYSHPTCCMSNPTYRTMNLYDNDYEDRDQKLNKREFQRFVDDINDPNSEFNIEIDTNDDLIINDSEWIRNVPITGSHAGIPEYNMTMSQLENILNDLKDQGVNITY